MMDVRWSVFFTARFVIMLPSLFQSTITFKQQGTCYFPERWEGTWFQSGVRQPIIIEGPRLSSKGRCLGSEGDKFLVVDDKRACYRCVVIHEKHANVLQYKETFCHSRESLPTLCSLITGDALLFSMFRENASPVACPFRGPFTFTYNRGHGECRTPVSSIDTCTEDSRLLLSYQACPDVYGSESTVEELQCLATWKEGSSRYLVGKVHHNHATSNEDRFRCFVYEKASPASEALDGVDYRVAQSGDATCNGLFSATEGSRTMILKRGECEMNINRICFGSHSHQIGPWCAPSLNKCRFPSWVMANSNHWHTLDYSATYSFHHRNSTLRVSNSSGMEMKVVCAQLRPFAEDNSASALLLTHYTMGCQSGFTCMAFYRRDMHVMEVQVGAHTKRQEDACNPSHFNTTSLPYVTLIMATTETRACPYTGKFQVSNLIHRQPETHYNVMENNYFVDKFYSSASDSSSHDDNDENPHIGESRRVFLRRSKRVMEYNGDAEQEECQGGFTTLVIGCNSVDTMELRDHRCKTPESVTEYSCHGGWKENGTYYLITTPLSRSSHGARRYCFIYKELSPSTSSGSSHSGTTSSGQENVVLFSTSAFNCDRFLQPGVTGQFIFNVTSTGKCIETNSSETRTAFSVLFLLTISYILNLVNASVFQIQR